MDESTTDDMGAAVLLTEIVEQIQIEAWEAQGRSYWAAAVLRAIDELRRSRNDARLTLAAMKLGKAIAMMRLERKMAEV